MLAALLPNGLQASADPDEVLRLVRDDQGRPAALEVAIVTLEAPGGARVDLVGAVHVGEPDYFDALNDRFGRYDSVLYELVVDDPDARPARGSGGGGLVSLLQGGMTEALGLEYQLDGIDYDREHFVHADLTAGEFAASMDERGESMIGMMVELWASALAAQQRGELALPETTILHVLFSDDRQLALRRMFAEQLVDQSVLMEALDDEDGSTLITARNQRAVDVLVERLAAGDRDVAIFYGAGHLPDLEQRLVEDRGMRRTDVDWLEAWRLR